METGDVGTTAYDVQVWDTGAIIDCRMPWKSTIPSKEEGFSKAQAVDGLLLATQYDLPWREDIFNGWHFYDISQCMEFMKAGYEVAVPWQESPWCDHDNLPSSIAVYYDFMNGLFVNMQNGQRFRKKESIKCLPMKRIRNTWFC